MKRICVLFTALILCGHIEAAERVVCVNPPKGELRKGPFSPPHCKRESIWPENTARKVTRSHC